MRRLIPLLILYSICAKSQKLSVPLRLLESYDQPHSSGVSWGVPFDEGLIITDTDFALVAETSDDTLALQSWPLAFWPDGSVKWMGLATTLPDVSIDQYHLISQPNHRLTKSPTVTEAKNHYQILSGDISMTIPKFGSSLISKIIYKEKVIATDCHLKVLHNDPGSQYQDPTELISTIDQVTIEQTGPIKTTVKIEGKHQSDGASISMIPFIIRLYVYRDSPTIRLTHTILYDGDGENEIISGIGVAIRLPLDEEMHNRHVRIAGDESTIWSEPIQPAYGRRSLTEDRHLYRYQYEGRRIPNRTELDERQQDLLNNWAVWDDFRLTQLSSHGYEIKKRTNEQSAWIKAHAGMRSEGMLLAGDVSGSIALTVRDFWQSYPSQIEVTGMRSDTATISAWLWAPEAEHMDMRHYDTLSWGHDLNASYEDVQPGLSTPTGVGRTSEVTLYLSDHIPQIDTLRAIVELTQLPPLLCSPPSYMHAREVFGQWSLPDTSSIGKAWIEKNLNNAFAFYHQEVDQRDWYGYWDYGDIMHSYDPIRHQWMYDVGGFAWANTELMPNLWLWYAYLRSGRSEIYRMAEAMTRHTSEVDVYHIGPLAGLGSRHNVRHWGCGSKEVRISQAGLHRIYYYLSTDERIGDIMTEVTSAANQAIGDLDPLRLILDPSEHLTHARMGPDWLALVSNWMTAWERTGDVQYRERIMTGFRSLAKMPYRLYSGVGAAMGYDPDTYQLYSLDSMDIGSSHLSVLMGGPEMMYELLPLLDEPMVDSLWLEFCQLYGASERLSEHTLGRAITLGDREKWSARLPAYYAYKMKDDDYADTAWQNFLSLSRWEDVYLTFDMISTEHHSYPHKLIEVPGVSTNSTAQWCLNAMQLMAMIGDEIPDEHPLFSE